MDWMILDQMIDLVSMNPYFGFYEKPMQNQGMAGANIYLNALAVRKIYNL